MAYVITQNCCSDASCVAACPVGCIHPTPDEPGFAAAEMLYIDPATCIDCGACADACPVDAIASDTALTPASVPYVEMSAAYYREATSAPVFARVPRPIPLLTRATPLHVAIVGSGPAGFYCASELLHHPGVRVEMFEKLSAPYGLVRYGVAPDHPRTKAIVDRFDFSPEKQQRFRLRLGVEIGSDVRHTDLLREHDAIIYAHGAFHARRLDIPGAGLPGSVPAAAFVGWYNDHPDHNGLTPPLDCSRAVVIGNGNVALDIARILVSDPDTLARTEMVRHAVAALRTSSIRDVVILGRRGPEHAAFTVPELLALTQLPGVDVVVDPTGLPRDATASRKLALLKDIAATPPTAGNKRVTLQFGAKPTEILGSTHVTGVLIGPSTALSAGLVVHAIGFRGQPIADVPFDAEHQTVPHAEGRVLDSVTGRPLRGVYTAGWIKRGPTGVIGTNRICAQETVLCLLADHAAGLLGTSWRFPQRIRRSSDARDYPLRVDHGRLSYPSRNDSKGQG